MRMIVAVALTGVLLTTSGADDKEKEKEVEKLLKKIEEAAKEKKYDDMIKFAKEAEKLDDKNPAIPFALGSAYTAQRKNQEAAEAFSKVIKLVPDVAVAYDRRGDANLKLGKFEDAVKDFDEYLKKTKDGQRKDADANHWRRGIALYYAGKHEDGAKQFDLHKGPNPEDVENAVWHYLCSVKAGKKKEDARKDLIVVKDDNRVPMKEVWKMFKDEKFQPPAVLNAVAEFKKSKASDEEKKEAEFYAHLYIALYYDSEGKEKEADCLKHLKEAVEKYKIGHYMWDVAKAHLDNFDKLKSK